jgi:hypothetical protein
MTSFAEPIVAVTLSAHGHTGITLYAPPWEDTDGEEWQGFLGDGAKIILLGSAEELSTWIEANPEHDLADHPAWTAFASQGMKALRPADEAHYDFEAVYELAAGEASPEVVSQLADAIDMAARVADCCEDGALRSIIGGSREYQLLLEGETSYHGKEGAGEWSKLGATIAENWSRALGRIEFWLNWQGSAAEVHPDHQDSAE